MTDLDERDPLDLTAWGWDDEWARVLRQINRESLEKARVTGQNRDRWDVQTRLGAGSARLRSAQQVDLYPVIGDWVLLEPGPMPSDPWSIAQVMPRRSQFSRGSAGTSEAEQILAANVDRVWIVHGLDIPPSPRKLERYLAVAWESGALPEIVLTKADLTPDLEAALATVREISRGVPIRVVSSVDVDGLNGLRERLEPGKTVVLLGPSGVGKSTLINLLAEAELAQTGTVRRRDRKGRHTTTRRELFQLAGGGLLLDTPGIRELKVWDLAEGLEQTFPEIEELARQCRFRDCRHEAEPGCAVLEAVEAGRLDEGRLVSYRKLQAEAAFQARKSDPLARGAAVSEHKTALKTLKQHPKYRDQS